MYKTDLSLLSDEDLVKLAQEGDLSAEELIIYRYKSHVLVKARAYFIVGGDREDIVQEGMIGLFKAVRDYNFEKNDNFYSFAEPYLKDVVKTININNR